MSQQRWVAPTTDAHSIETMKNSERAAALRELYHELDALIEPEEILLYPTLQHLKDLINDLEIEGKR